jgi:hypothetical protein
VKIFVYVSFSFSEGNSNEQHKAGVTAGSKSPHAKDHHKQTSLFDQVTPFVAWTVYFPNKR